MRGALSSAAVSPTLLHDLHVAFHNSPTHLTERHTQLSLESTTEGAQSPEGIQETTPAIYAPTMYVILASMLRDDLKRRPSIDALLAHPLLAIAKPLAPGDPTVECTHGEGAAGGEGVGGEGVGGEDVGGESVGGESVGDVSVVGKPATWLEEMLDLEGCSVMMCETFERALSVRIELSPPFGLLLSEAAGGAVVDEILDGGSAKAFGGLREGDRLISVGEVSVRDASFDEVRPRS